MEAVIASSMIFDHEVLPSDVRVGLAHGQLLASLGALLDKAYKSLSDHPMVVP